MCLKTKYFLNISLDENKFNNEYRLKKEFNNFYTVEKRNS